MVYPRLINGRQAMMMQDVQAQPRLTTAEWQAVTIALRDAERAVPMLASDRPERGLARLFRLVTGIERARPLADPQLDAVRRFVWASRRHIAKAREIATELRAFGYSCAQIEALQMVAA
jgi:hypothetical protein